MKIKIGNSKYEIIKCSSIETEGQGLCMGQCNYFKKTIEIVVDTNLANKEQIKKNITHELTHAYMYEHCVTNEWISDFEKSYEEEKICCFFANFGESIIRDTEKIYNSIFKGGKDNEKD